MTSTPEICKLCLQNNIDKNHKENVLMMLTEIFVDRLQFTNDISCCFQCVIKLKQTYQFVLMVKESQLKLSTNSIYIKQEPLIEEDPLSIIDESNIKIEEDPWDTDTLENPNIQPEQIEITNVNYKEEINSINNKSNIDNKTKKKKIGRPSRIENIQNGFEYCKSIIDTLKDYFQASVDNSVEKVVVSACSSSSIKQDFDNIVINCTKCKNSFDTLPELKQHIRSIHKEFVCNSCNSIFGNQRLYDMHLEKFCYFDVESEKGLDNVKKMNCDNKSQIIPEPETVLCEMCGQTVNISGYRNHIKFHKRPKKQCDKCGKFSYQNCRCDEKLGATQMEERQFACNYCDKRFFKKKARNCHIKTKHIKMQSDPCPNCKKTFYCQQALKIHMRQHTNETPFRCEICGIAYRYNVSLKAHKKSKHNIFEEITCHCQKCGKGFGSETALLSHLKVHQ